MTLKRFRTRAMSKAYDDPGPDLLRPRDNAERQFADNMGKAAMGWFVRTNPPGDREDWTDWTKPIKRGEVLRRLDAWQAKAGDGAKFQAGRKAKDGKPDAKTEMVVVSVREIEMPGVNAGARTVASLFNAQFGGDEGGFNCREYNNVPGSGWSDHAWGDAVDLDVNAGSPGKNDVISDWLVRMGKADCLSGAAQLIGSKGGKVYAWYAPSFAAKAGGPVSHLTHVHCSYRQHYGRDPELPMTDGRRVDVYEDASGEWRWRRIATGNGEVVADSGEGYTRSADASEAAGREFPDDEVRILDDPEADEPVALSQNPQAIPPDEA